MLFYMEVFIGFFLYLTQIVWFKSFPKVDLWISLTGVFYVIAFVAYFSALKISLSQSILFQSYSILVTIILAAVFLGEGKYFDLATTSGIKVVSGIILATVALWYLLHVGNQKEERLERKWFWDIFLTIIFLGVGSFASVSFLRQFTPVEILINQTNTMVVLLFVLIKAQRIKMSVAKKDFSLMFANSFFSIIAALAFFKILLFIPVAKLYPVQQVSLVMITIFTGVIFYKESKFFTGKRLIGMILGLGGILLLVTS